MDYRQLVTGIYTMRHDEFPTLSLEGLSRKAQWVWEETIKIHLSMKNNNSKWKKNDYYTTFNVTILNSESHRSMPVLLCCTRCGLYKATIPKAEVGGGTV